MKKHVLELLAPGIFAAAALALVVSVGAQTTPPPAPPPAPMAGHPMDKAPRAKNDSDLKMECQAIMAKKQEMHDKRMAMDAALDTLVAEMNAAQASSQADAMEKSMAAVINELVAQSKASHAMTMEMEAAMVAHMMSHMKKMDAMRGAMDCPMMKMGMPSKPEAEEKAPAN
jgi:hypothetical protein